MDGNEELDLGFCSIKENDFTLHRPLHRLCLSPYINVAFRSIMLSIICGLDYYFFLTALFFAKFDVFLLLFILFFGLVFITVFSQFSCLLLLRCFF